MRFPVKKVGLHVSLETPTAVCLPKKTMEKEIWKAVEGYEDWYEVSNFGNVRSVDRVVNYNDGRKFHYKGQIRKIKKHPNGYLFCDLSKNTKHKTFNVHRLVAQAFLPNPNNLPEVNHRDENKTNNCVDNLEWCTHLHNVNYGTATQRRAEKTSKSVLQIGKDTNEIIAEYASMAEAGRQLNINQGNISNCCLHRCKTAGGFKWRYKE